MSSDEHKSGESGAPRSAVAARLLPNFIAHRRRDAGTIREAIPRGDFETISRLGHNMRGNGRSYGFPVIGAIGERMETAANIRNLDSILNELRALEDWIEAIGAPGASGDEQPPRSQSATRIRAATDEGDAADDPGRRGGA